MRKAGIMAVQQRFGKNIYYVSVHRYFIDSDGGIRPKEPMIYSFKYDEMDKIEHLSSHFITMLGLITKNNIEKLKSGEKLLFT